MALSASVGKEAVLLGSSKWGKEPCFLRRRLQPVPTGFNISVMAVCGPKPPDDRNDIPVHGGAGLQGLLVGHFPEYGMCRVSQHHAAVRYRHKHMPLVNAELLLHSIHPNAPLAQVEDQHSNTGYRILDSSAEAGVFQGCTDSLHL